MTRHQWAYMNTSRERGGYVLHYMVAGHPIRVEAHLMPGGVWSVRDVDFGPVDEWLHDVVNVADSFPLTDMAYRLDKIRRGAD